LSNKSDDYQKTCDHLQAIVIGEDLQIIEIRESELRKGQFNHLSAPSRSMSSFDLIFSFCPDCGNKNQLDSTSK